MKKKATITTATILMVILSIIVCIEVYKIVSGNLAPLLDIAIALIGASAIVFCQHRQSFEPTTEEIAQKYAQNAFSDLITERIARDAAHANKTFKYGQLQIIYNHALEDSTDILQRMQNLNHLLLTAETSNAECLIYDAATFRLMDESAGLIGNSANSRTTSVAPSEIHAKLQPAQEKLSQKLQDATYVLHVIRYALDHPGISAESDHDTSKLDKILRNFLNSAKRPTPNSGQILPI